MFVLSNWTKRFLKNITGIMITVFIFGVFLEAILEAPVMELNHEGKCLRVINENGIPIPNGCKDATNDKLATEHRFVGK